MDFCSIRRILDNDKFLPDIEIFAKTIDLTRSLSGENKQSVKHRHPQTYLPHYNRGGINTFD